MATRVVAEGLKPEETAVSKVMTRNPTFVAGDTLAIEALDKMVQGAAFLNLFYFSPRVLLNLSATRILMSWSLRKKAVTAEDGKAPFVMGQANSGTCQSWSMGRWWHCLTSQSVCMMP